jgi:RHS repeat-associated protein
MTYDLNGNLATLADGSGTTTYAWNPRNQLTGLSGPSLTASFTYDALGRRWTKTVNAAQTDFLYDGLNPVQEGVLPSTPSANLLTGLGFDEFFTRTDAAGLRALLPDALGSIMALTDSAGVVQTEYTYAPFGATTVTGATSTNPYQFTGREHEATGLYYYRARYYHPTLSRFVPEDPLEFGGGDPNLYTYVHNNPMAWRDPLGLRTVGISVGASGAILGHGGSVTVSLVTDSPGNLGVQVTVGAGGAGGALGGGVGAGITITGAGTIHQLEGPGATAGISLPRVGPVVPVVSVVTGSGYVGGTLGGGVGIGTILAVGEVTHTQCLLGCRKSPPPNLPPVIAP